MKCCFVTGKLFSTLFAVKYQYMMAGALFSFSILYGWILAEMFRLYKYCMIFALIFMSNGSISAGEQVVINVKEIPGFSFCAQPSRR